MAPPTPQPAAEGAVDDGSRLLRRQHVVFIMRMYGLSAAMLAVALIQWMATTISTTTIHWLYYHKYLIVLVLFVGFLLLITFAFYFKDMQDRSRFCAICFTFLTMEINTITLLRPMLETNYLEEVLMAGATAVAITVFLVVSLVKHSRNNRTTDFYAKWTLRIYISVALGLPVSYAFRSIHFDVVFASVILCVLLLFMVFTSITLGCDAFWEAEKPDYVYFGTLHYCNMLTFYSCGLMLMAQVRLLTGISTGGTPPPTVPQDVY